MKFIAVIPARYASSRFPGKPLVMIKGKPMIQRVYEQAQKAFENVVVATDDERIQHAVEQFGGLAVMTSTTHKSGTDRCAEAITLVGGFEDFGGVVVNVQGDEPFIHPEQLELLKDCFTDEKVQIATLVKPITENTEIFNPNLPKVIFTKDRYAIYFSRSPIPYVRDHDSSYWQIKFPYYRHIGLYAYRSHILKEIVQLPQSPLELAESLEQNRWIEHGYNIKINITDRETIGIDSPEDLKKINS